MSAPYLANLLPKLDEVVRVRLRVAIRHEDGRVAHVVDSRVKKDRAVARLVRVTVRDRVRAMARVWARVSIGLWVGLGLRLG